MVAVAAYQQGRYADAEREAEETFELRKASLGADHPDTLSSLNVLGVASLEGGNARKGRDLLTQLCATYLATRGPDDRALLIAQNNLALAHFYLGEYEQAESLYRNVLARRTASLGRRNPSTLAVATSVGNTVLVRGRGGEALDLALAFAEDFAATFNDRHPETLRYRYLLSRTYLDVGRHDLAASLAESVVAQANATLGRAHGDTLRYTINLGRARYHLRDYVGALDAFATAARVADEALGPQHRQSLVARRNAAFCLLRLGRYEEAARAFEESLAGRPDALGRDFQARHGLHEAQFEMGQRDVALRGMEENLAGVRRLYGEGNNQLVPYLTGVANYFLIDGARERAEGMLEEGVAIMEATRLHGFLAEDLRQSRLAAVTEDDPGGAGLKALVQLRIARGNFDGALRLSELLKARTLSESMDLRAAASAQGLSRRDFDDVMEVLQRIDQLNHGAGTATPGGPEALAIAAQRQQLERTLQTKAASLEGPARRDPLQALETNAAFVSFVVNREHVTALVARRGIPVRGFVLGELPRLSDTLSAYRQWRSSIAPANERVWRMADGSFRWSLARPDNARRATSAAEIENELSRRLLAPLAASLRGVRRWHVSPDGPLALIPFELLSIDGKPVLARHDLAYTQSLRVLAISRGRTTASTGLFAVAATEKPVLPPPGRPPGASSVWTPLAAAREEVESVARAYRGAPVKLLVGSEATEAAVRELARTGELARFRYLHFAAHGYLSNRHPQLSSIVLAGDGKSADSDGYLMAAEIPGLRLQSELAVISACDSGSGTVVSGEGVLGLPYALALAGNRRTILALWEVDDRFSAQFMPAFYRRLSAGASPARALAETKRTFAKPGSRWSDPRYWSAFVLYGD